MQFILINGLVRAFFEGYIELTISAFIQMTELKGDTFGQGLNAYLAIQVFVINVAAPILLPVLVVMNSASFKGKICVQRLGGLPQ